MNDEDFNRLKAYAERYGIPPGELLPKGIGVPVHIDDSLERPVFGDVDKGERCEIRLSQADCDEANRRTGYVPDSVRTGGSNSG